LFLHHVIVHGIPNFDGKGGKNYNLVTVAFSWVWERDRGEGRKERERG